MLARASALLFVLVAYVWTPSAYTKGAPLKSWTFTISLPRAKVTRLIVHDFERKGKLWVDGYQSVSRMKQGPIRWRGSSYVVTTNEFDMVARWERTGRYTWEEVSKCSPLFLDLGTRPRPEEIVESPGLEWAAEWKLHALSKVETEVTRTIFKFEQRTNRLLPMHLLIPLAFGAEHGRMRTNFA